MIPNVGRGDRMVGLLAYLVGPGRENEHTQPHVVAGSDMVMALHGDTELDHEAALELGKYLDAPRKFHEASIKGGHVWHASLSVSAVEGSLGDETWGEIAESFVHKMGFDTQDGTKGPMRWAAVHHGESTAGNDHVHLAVQLIRENGTKADFGFDYKRAQTASREIEHEFGLVQLETEKSQVSEPGYSRPEYEATARRRAEAKYEGTRGDEDLHWSELSKKQRGPLVAEMKREIKRDGLPREQMKVEVRAAAATSSSEPEFVARLHHAGLSVRPFYADKQQSVVGGYQVAMPSKYGEQPWFVAGGNLGNDLSLNRLREQWEHSPDLMRQATDAWTAAGRNLDPDSAGQVQWSQSPAEADEHRFSELDEHFRKLRQVPLKDRDRWALEAHRTSGMLAAWSKAGGPDSENLAAASRSLARSAGLRRSPQVDDRTRPKWMVDGALLVAQAAKGGQSTASQVIMMQQIMKTVQAIAKVHEATEQRRRTQEVRQTLEADLKKVQAALPATPEPSTPKPGSAHEASFPEPAAAAVRKTPNVPQQFPRTQSGMPTPIREPHEPER